MFMFLVRLRCLLLSSLSVYTSRSTSCYIAYY
nr:MAG TPA: hypothetical protein [Caudoviricetes sp.]